MRQKVNQGVSIYQIKITLLNTNPLVWRRIEVPSNISLNNLSYSIQEAMGWEGYHLYLFVINGTEYSERDDHDTIYDEWKDDKKIKVREAFENSSRVNYLYDFGDNWEHEILFEKEKLVEPNQRYPVCVGGENNCPPEDVGGVHRFAEYKKILQDKTHPRYSELFDWRGAYDATEFSVQMTNFKMMSRRIAKNLKLKKRL